LQKKIEKKFQVMKTGNVVFDIEAILNIMPHRYPFLLVDRIIDMDIDKKIIGIKNVTHNEPFFQGHFPTRKIMPGVLIVEAMVQCGCILLLNTIENPGRPLCAILGGSKISGKIDVLENLLNVADKILIGGGMMFTFYKALGYNTGKSILEEDKIALAKEVFEKAKSENKELLLPVDVVYADKFENDAKLKILPFDKVTEEYNDWIGMDIGPKTIKKFTDEILKSKTIVWNGPMGVFEMSNFARGTFEIAKALADATANGSVTVVGGGDSASAISSAELDDKVTHVSTGGGASLEFLEGKKLPGIESLNNDE